MTILSRRNALIGWAVVKFARRAAKRKARSVGGDPKTKAVSSLGAALAAAGGALLIWRRRHGDADDHVGDEGSA